MKKFLEITALAAVLFFTVYVGYRQGADESDKRELYLAEQKELPDQQEEISNEQEAKAENTAEQMAEYEESGFLFQIDTLYYRVNTADADWMDNAEGMVGGHIESGEIKPGDKAVLVKSDGSCYETTVEKIMRQGEMDYFLEEAGGNSLLFIWLEGIDYDMLENGDLLLGSAEWERGVSIDFPFEGSEEYSLTLAFSKSGDKQGELWLYDSTGEVVQRIPYGTFTERIYYIVYKDNRRNLVFFSDDESNAGRFLEWNDGRFLEQEMDIKRGLLPYGDLLLTQESQSELTMEIYRCHPNERLSEEIRRFTLQKDTGELEIWDCLDRKNIFQGIVSVGEDGKPVNEEYYQIIFTEGLYAWFQDGKHDKVPVDLWAFGASDEYSAEYESREKFLSDYGFAGSNPIYEFYDRMDNLRLELYGNENESLFCGILYRYFYSREKEKCFRMSGFVVDDIEDAEWVDDTYSLINSLDGYGYEKSIEYTSDKKPKYVLETGMESEDGGAVSEDRESVALMEIVYIYRDDGTLYDRHYWHNPYWFGSTRSSEDSLYDEKERLVYKQAYITHGTLEDYYIYPDDGDKPSYRLEFDYGGGAAPATYMVRYR